MYYYKTIIQIEFNKIAINVLEIGNDCTKDPVWKKRVNTTVNGKVP